MTDSPHPNTCVNDTKARKEKDPLGEKKKKRKERDPLGEKKKKRKEKDPLGEPEGGDVEFR